jgi:hypothetical protein
MNELISHSVTRWSLPIVIFLTIYGIFKFIDGSVSPEVKQFLSEFLKANSYERYLGVLPFIMENAFVKIFSAKHFSRRCIISSLLFSWWAILATLLFSLLYNCYKFVNLASKDLVNANIMAQKAHDQAGVGLWEKTPTYKIWILYICAWLFWGLIPDYLALLKIRIMLLVMKYTDTRNTSLVVPIIIDFMVGL